MEDTSRKEQLEKIENEIQKLIANGKSNPIQRAKSSNYLLKLLYEHKYLLAGTYARSQYFEDGWARTMEHFFLNLWEIKTEKTKSAYCESSTIFMRLSKYLKHRINDLDMESNNHWSLNSLSLDVISGGNIQSIADILSAPDNEEYLWLHELVELDKTGMLKSTMMKMSPEVNCQNILLMFLQGYSWREIAENFNVREQALYSFIRRQCWPLMHREIKELWTIL